MQKRLTMLKNHCKQSHRVLVSHNPYASRFPACFDSARGYWRCSTMDIHPLMNH